MGSADMAFKQILVVAVIVGTVAGQLPRSGTPTTQVPILRFLDQKNNDGSYTYGFESGDGTYKIETRLANGQVKGKYGYIDSNGVLQETVYGATEERGFEPEIEGVVVAPPTLVDETDYSQVHNVVTLSERPSRPGSRFSNFKARNSPANTFKTGQVVDNNIKIVNGRRAILKKRPVTRPAPTTIRPEVLHQQQLRARQQELRALEAERQAVLTLHQDRYQSFQQPATRSFQQPATRSFQQQAPQTFQQLQSAPRSFHQPAPQTFQQQQPAPQTFQQPREVFRTQPQSFDIFANHPYISAYNSGIGSYSYSYGK